MGGTCFRIFKIEIASQKKENITVENSVLSSDNRQSVKLPHFKASFLSNENSNGCRQPARTVRLQRQNGRHH